MTWTFRRRSLFVHPFQYRILVMGCFYGLALVLVVGGIVFLPLMHAIDAPGLSLEEKDRIAREFLQFHDRLWPWLGVLFAAIAVHSVFFIHRIAGPIYRFGAIFKTMLEGRFDIRARLRRHDYLKPEADALNGVLTELEERVQRVERRLLGIQTLCASLSHVVAGHDRSKILSAQTTLAEQLRQLRADLHGHGPSPSRAADEPCSSGYSARLDHTDGFTLIEVMMIVAIIGALAGIAIPNYLAYLEKVRVVRAIAEISALSKEIDGYFYTNDDTYPDSLAAIGRDQLLDPWGNPYQYLKIAGATNGGGHAAVSEQEPLRTFWSWLLPAAAYAAGGHSGQGSGNGSAGGGSGGGASSGQGGSGNQSTGQGGGAGGGGGESHGGGSVVGRARKDRFLVPINSDYDLYSKGKDGDSHPPLGAHSSRDDVIRANDGGFIGLASSF